MAQDVGPEFKLQYLTHTQHMVRQIKLTRKSSLLEQSHSHDNFIILIHEDRTSFKPHFPTSPQYIIKFQMGV
jgi:hypothetical protein